MSKLAVTNFSKRTGSPFQAKTAVAEPKIIVHQEKLQNTQYEKQKLKQNELKDKVNKKTAEIQSQKEPSSDGCFTEVVTHGAFTSKNNRSLTPPKSRSSPTNGTKSPLLGFPSSANDLALDAKSDLESDPNISKEVKDKVIEKLFTLVSMVQHAYESKVRVMTEFDKFKDSHLKNELRREKEHSEQMYKLNMNFQSEVVQAIQQLKSEFDISRNATKDVMQEGSKDSSIVVYSESSEDTEVKNSDAEYINTSDCNAN